MVPAHVETVDGSQWQNIDNSDEKDKYIGYNIEKVESRQSLRGIHISETPRVKIIAEKFSKLKKNNVELRKLDEKVVCVEYDVYVGDNMSKPQQTMRAFFSIKPACKEEEKGKTFKESVTPSVVPSKIKQTFEIGDEDLKKSKEKEIEMIDGKISENRSYLDDLKKILKHNHAVAKKNKNTLDLMSLYEMAKKEVAPLNSNSNLLSKAELEEIKDLILNKCASSVQGISRRRVKRELDSEFGKERGVLSQSLVAELMREGNV
ncbi:uncharacterized protein LOC116413188 [Galleria mellonella]|uniref:Uncharacterized protein LOC116413188 n=1 Tax=Galleria mellonella TaxID=7137 RepID=A0ABM3MVP7_GALME|nr:uncharacterized protein LOC116413188 [Galleria mellonella]